MATTTERAAAELKQQGAIEAAQKSNGAVTSAEAQAKIVQESNEAGIMAFSFDPDATPEEKKAQARAVRFSFLSCPLYLGPHTNSSRLGYPRGIP